MNDGKETRWYTVALLYETVHSGELRQINGDEEDSTKTFEESHILVRARTEGEAMASGQRIGRDNEVSYENVYGETVHWRLIKVLDCFELLRKTLQQGARSILATS